MNKPNMDDALMALRCGRLSFEAFERRSRQVWTNVAEHMLRHWRAPAAVSVEDLRQEILLNVWIFVAHWDPQCLGPDGKPVSISRFVTFNAYDKAKKWLHQQRNAYRRDDKAPGRFERPFSTMRRHDDADGRDLEEQMLDRLASDPEVSPLEQRQAILERYSAAAPVHRPVVLALAETRDVDLAAERLRQNGAACVALRIESMNGARRAVIRALKAIATA